MVLSSLVVLACGDDGGNGGETTQAPTMVSSTNSTPATDSAGTDSAGTGSASATEDTPTGGMSDSLTSNSTTSPTDTSDATSSQTSTDPTASTGQVTMSDPSTGGSTGSTDPSGTTTEPSETTGQVDPGTTTSDDTTTTLPPDDTEDIPCSVQMATLNPVAPNIVLVLDKSGSMLITWDHDANGGTPPITRWASLHSVVSAIVNEFDLKINFGAALFPAKNATNEYTMSACVVQSPIDVTVGPNKGTPIINTIPAANNMTIKGGTPSATGMTRALDHLKTLDPLIPRAVLFITDGAANCGMGLNPPPLFEQYDDTLHTIVQDAFTNDQIPTYVIGIDIQNSVTPNTQDGNPNGINPYDKLNDVANKGGKPKNDPTEKFYNANNQIELNAALDTIIADALSCEISLDSEPAKPEFTEVEIQGVEVPYVPTCNGMNGWTWVNPNGPYDALVLCGTACSQLKMVGEADVNFFCVPN